MHLYDRLCQVEFLREAWEVIRHKNARGGIDGISPSQMEGEIEKVLTELSEKLSSGTYVPAPYERVHIPKFNKTGELRPLSLPVVIDKIVQQAFVNLSAPLFEKTFLDCSYAYRANKGPVKAVRRVEHIIRHMKPQWVVLCDIDNFFDNLNHERLLFALNQKIEDERMLSLVRLWLKAGSITQKGDYLNQDKGIAQGAIVSPLLSNIYLHPLDSFAVSQEVFYVRYSDNFIILSTVRDQGLASYISIKDFLEKELLLSLNPDPDPVKKIQDGFEFLGISFKGSERGISKRKEEKTIQEINWLTDVARVSNPDVFLKRINEHIQSKKRFYSFINPQRQFQAFDDHLVKRLKKILMAFNQKGLLPTRKKIFEFLNRIEFYIDRQGKEKDIFLQRNFQDAPGRITPKIDESEKSTKEEKVLKEGGKRTQPQANRFLQRVSSEAEIVISTPGIFIGKNSQRLVLRLARKNIMEQPLSKIRHITVATSGITLSSDVISSCAIEKIPVIFLNRAGKIYAALHSPLHSMGELSLLQLRMCQTEMAFSWIKRLLDGKSRNQMNVLKFYCRHRSRTDALFLEKAKNALEEMENILKEIQELKFNESFETVRNKLFLFEARISSYYWDIIKLLLPSELQFEKREKQGAKDVVNCMLNYGYGILYYRVWRAVLIAGLNPHISFFHSFNGHEPTLVYDMIEEFRQTMVDKPLFSLMTRGKRYKKLKVDHNTGLLDNFTRELTLKIILTRLSTLIRYRGRSVRGEDVIQAQASNLVHYIRGKKKYRPFVSTY